jgi:hypothetical protein
MQTIEMKNLGHENLVPNPTDLNTLTKQCFQPLGYESITFSRTSSKQREERGREGYEGKKGK